MLPEQEYEQFKQWYEKTYGGGFSLFGGRVRTKLPAPISNDVNITSNPYYQYWRSYISPAPTQYTPVEGYGEIANRYLELYDQYLRSLLSGKQIDMATYENTMAVIQTAISKGEDPANLPGAQYWQMAQWEYSQRKPPSKKSEVLEKGIAIRPGVIEYQGKLYDENGVELGPDYFRKFEEDELTKYQKAQIARWQTEQASTEKWREEQLDLERARLAQGGKQDTMEQIRADLENRYEMDRLKDLAGLGANPMDWIKRYERIHDVNPYTQQVGGVSPAQWAQVYSQAAARNVAGSQGIFNRLPYTAGLPSGVPQSTFQLGNIPETQSQVALNMLYSAKLQEATAQQAQVEAGKLQAYNAATGGYGGLAPNPSAPPPNAPAPFWLSQFVPNQVTGQSITRQRVGTPSPQTWGATPWSVQQGLKGYAEWAGGEPLIDIIGRMESMIPIGGTAKRWLPRRQKTFV